MGQQGLGLDGDHIPCSQPTQTEEQKVNKNAQYLHSTNLPRNDAYDAAWLKIATADSVEASLINQSGFQCTYVPQLGALIRGGGSVHLKPRGEA